MADNVRYDDFVSKVQADPASPQSTIMLQGYVGHGPEGHIRIYPDPTLGNWYDVPEADIVHSMPVEDSKLGGSYVWIKSSSAIKPGGAAADAQQGQAQAAAAAVPAAHLLPTPQTHCFICPPHTETCTPATICTHLPQCPVLTHVVCSNVVACPPRTPDCQIVSAVCLTPAIHCPPPVTPHCTAPTLCCPPPTPLHGCPPTPLCTQPLHGCPPPVTVHPPQCTLHCPSSPIICDTLQPSLGFACTVVNCHTPPVVCQQVATGQPGCNFGNVTNGCGVQPGGQQVHPQVAQGMAAAAPAPAPAAGPAAQAFTQHICPTPSAVQQCVPHLTPATICTHQIVCGGGLTHNLCPSLHVVCPTLTNHVLCHQTVGLACLQTAQTPCLPITLGGCTPQSIACLTPQFTPIQNGVFNPFGR